MGALVQRCAIDRGRDDQADAPNCVRRFRFFFDIEALGLQVQLCFLFFFNGKACLVPLVNQ